MKRNLKPKKDDPWKTPRTRQEPPYLKRLRYKKGERKIWAIYIPTGWELTYPNMNLRFLPGEWEFAGQEEYYYVQDFTKLQPGCKLPHKTKAYRKKYGVQKYWTAPPPESESDAEEIADDEMCNADRMDVSDDEIV